MKIMKNLFFIGLIALAAVITLAGCPTGDDDGGNNNNSANNNGNPSNPFTSTWGFEGDNGSITITFTDSTTWETEIVDQGNSDKAKGTYTRNENTATLTPTHVWNNGSWETAPDQIASASASITENTMTLTFPGQSPGTLTKQ
jgi:hypothetical protein